MGGDVTGYSVVEPVVPFTDSQRPMMTSKLRIGHPDRALRIGTSIRDGTIMVAS